MTQEYNRLLKDALVDNMWAEAKLIAKTNPEIILDITGIFDPTPISDGAAGVVALFRGDWLGAGLSGASLIPYLGDALAKPSKFAKYGSKMAGIAEAYFKKADSLASMGKKLADHLDLDQIARAREAALKKVRDAMEKARKGDANCKECEQLNTQKKSRMPTDEKGTWDPPNARETGTGKITLKEPLIVDGKQIEVIEFKDGFPVFDDYTLKIDGQSIAVDIPHITGNATTDGAAALEQLKASGVTVPKLDGYTWHHTADGKLSPVLSSVHNHVAHTGSASMVKTELF